jgi:hypothetical protein
MKEKSGIGQEKGKDKTKKKSGEKGVQFQNTPFSPDFISSLLSLYFKRSTLVLLITNCKARSASKYFLAAF